MNQDQRKFLLARVEQTYKTEERKLDEDKPKEPSLNNYLVAAVLDGSIKMKSIEEIRDHVRDKVLKLGNQETLVHETMSRYSSSTDTPYHSISLQAAAVFVLPDAYLKAKEEYETKKAAIEKKKDALYAQKETLLLKIQIGSNTSLDRLIDSVDNMIDITLMNSKLMLTDGKEEK